MQTLLKPVEESKPLSMSNQVEKWRPFLTERAWSLWLAYNGFFFGRVTKATAIKLGNDDLVSRLWEVNMERELVKSSTTPEILALFDVNQFTGGTKALTYWEVELMAELRRGLAGEESGPDAVRKASLVIEAITEIEARVDIETARRA